MALQATRTAIKKAGKIHIPRIIPFESKVIVSYSRCKEQKMDEDRRHNEVLEEIGKKDHEFYLSKTVKKVIEYL